MKSINWLFLCPLVAALSGAPLPAAESIAPLRPPSVPLIPVDPYFSIWSPADRLTDAATVHWTGKRHALSCLVRIDGKTYRLMGTEPSSVPALPQKELEITPTRTIYHFENEQVHVDFTFFIPYLPQDIEVMSRPLTYLNWSVNSVDQQPHQVSVYFDCAGEVAVNTPEQQVTWDRPAVAGLQVARIGSKDQPILGKRGDDLRIDWGYLYAAVPQKKSLSSSLGNGSSLRQAFSQNQPFPAQDDAQQPRPANQSPPTMAFAMDLGQVGKNPVQSHLLLAYDDIYSLVYFGQRVRPYWRRNGAEAADLLKTSEKQFASLLKKAERFDRELLADAEKIGGLRYARIVALAYRQCMAANKIVADDNGQPLLFPKENFSNGCIGTVDVIYPMDPQFLLLSPALAKASLVPILDYGNSARWRFSFAPHDVGTYPIANGQVYGEGERGERDQMPVEESGNMILLMAGVAKAEGHAKFAEKYWPLLTRWADYLRSKGLDPENQLCTDDFAGHLAHNVNLSAKAILALAAYADLARQLGKTELAQEYGKISREFAQRWVQMADDGDHTRLAFDKPGTWSQKYNLVWDRVLGLNTFPESVFRKEVDFYRKTQNKYGLPLDNRQTYTKLDWITWSATLTGDQAVFEALVNPIYDFLNATPDRTPMTDWYQTQSGKMQGFQARSVVGGVFIRFLAVPEVWEKWVKRSEKIKGNWAPLPILPEFQPLVAAADTQKSTWNYTLEQPASDWFNGTFDDSQWKTGTSGFGTHGTPGSVIGTEWKNNTIWLRRNFELSNVPRGAILLWVHHDEDAEIYINGILAATLSAWSSSYEPVELSSAARASLKPGKNSFAIHCRQNGGGQYIDAGLVTIKEPAQASKAARN